MSPLIEDSLSNHMFWSREENQLAYNKTKLLKASREDFGKPVHLCSLALVFTISTHMMAVADSYIPKANLLVPNTLTCFGLKMLLQVTLL